MTDEGLVSTIERIRAGAHEATSYVVEAFPDGERPEGYQVAMPLDEFLSLLNHLKPRLLYFQASTFNVREDALRELLPGLESSEETQREMLSRPDVANLVQRFKRYDGENDLCRAAIVCDGILHSVYQRAPWVEEFLSEAGGLRARYDEEQEEEDERIHEIDRAKVREFAVKLCENPKFNEGRPSREKRTYLAQNLFPDLTEDEIYEVVDEATNLGWMKAK